MEANKHKHCAAAGQEGCCGHGQEHCHEEHGHGEHGSHQHGHEHGHGHGGECGCGHGHEHGHEDGCGCGHDHGAGVEKSEAVGTAWQVAGAIALLVLGHFAAGWPAVAVYLAAYLLAGHGILWSALKNITRGRIFDENFLMAVASLGAFTIGDMSEAVAVIIFYRVGELLQDLAVSRSRKNIAGLMDIRPDFAVLYENGSERRVDPGEVAVGQLIRIRPGERVPLDCTVTDGESAVDASALTGESVPVAAAPGAALASGSVNLSGLLTAQVTAVYGDSTVQKILDLVSEAGDKKAKAEQFITKFARIYTPAVMALAALIVFVPPFFTGWATFSDWLYRGLVFLVVSCPCALVLSIPVSFMGGIGGAARNGILVKGGDVVDRLRAPKAVVFDKTGTLTLGEFAVSRVLPAPGVEEGELLAAAALCERSSGHPIAVSVRRYCADRDPGGPITAYEELAGMGVAAHTEQGVYYAGNARLMEKAGAAGDFSGGSGAGTLLLVARGSQYLGSLLIRDEVKPGAKEAVARLRELGVKKLFMLTGDREGVAKEVAEAVGLDGYKAGLLPQDKVAAFEELTKDVEGVTLYTGDGINDAPLLARADVGVAMGGVGSDAAIEAADLVLMTDEVEKIGSAIRIARATRSIVLQNIVFALGVKLVVLALAAFGMTPMWLAIFADVGVALIAVANAARAVFAKP